MLLHAVDVNVRCFKHGRASVSMIKIDVEDGR